MQRQGRTNLAVDVVVPSYNHAPFIEACLRSIFAQTYPPARLVVIDDGSTDGSPALIARVLRDCPFPAEFVARPNRGLAATLNESLEHTGGELFAYLGSDDLWHPERLREAVRMFQARPRALATFGACYLIDHHDRILNLVASTPLEGHRRLPWQRAVPGPRVTLETLLRFTAVPLSPTVTYRRSVVERFGWNAASPVEDYEMDLRVAAVGEFAFIERPLAAWRLHPRNTSKELDVMLEAVQAAQRRVGRELGLPPRALRTYQASARYAYGEHFLRAGRWSRGVALTLGNLTAAPPSPSALAERLARIVLQPLLRTDTGRQRPRQAPGPAPLVWSGHA